MTTEDTHEQGTAAGGESGFTSKKEFHADPTRKRVTEVADWWNTVAADVPHGDRGPDFQRVTEREREPGGDGCDRIVPGFDPDGGVEPGGDHGPQSR